MRATALLLTGLLALAVTGAWAQSNWDSYKPATFMSIVELHKSSVDASDQTYSARSFPSRIKVAWTGKVRAIEGDRKRFLSRFFMIINRKDAEALFQREILVREGVHEMWVPIQEQLLPHLEKEVAPGKDVLVFTIWMGAIKTSLGHEWIFGINEFEGIP